MDFIMRDTENPCPRFVAENAAEGMKAEVITLPG